MALELKALRPGFNELNLLPSLSLLSSLKLKFSFHTSLLTERNSKEEESCQTLFPPLFATSKSIQET